MDSDLGVYLSLNLASLPITKTIINNEALMDNTANLILSSELTFPYIPFSVDQGPFKHL